jgi:hypothetical protein
MKGVWVSHCNLEALAKLPILVTWMSLLLRMNASVNSYLAHQVLEVRMVMSAPKVIHSFQIIMASYLADITPRYSIS